MHSNAEQWPRQYFDLLPFFFSGHLITPHILLSESATKLGARRACWTISSDAKLVPVPESVDDRPVVTVAAFDDSTSAPLPNSKSATSASAITLRKANPKTISAQRYSDGHELEPKGIWICYICAFAFV